MKRVMILTTLMLAALFLVSCGGAETVTTPAVKTTAPATTSEPAQEVVEIEDVAKVPSGDYIVGKEVYRLDKEAKTLEILDFNMEYLKYKNDEGTLVYETGIGFYNIAGYERIVYMRDGVEYRIYESAGKIYHAKVGNGSSSSTSILPFPDTVILPTFGSYVSGPLEQFKVDSEGNRVKNPDGSFERETFYLFLDLTKASVKLYVGWDDTTHWNNPILSLDGYVLSYNTAGLSIRVPHSEGSTYALRLTIKAGGISFVNDTENYGDYSGSGVFTLIK